MSGHNPEPLAQKYQQLLYILNWLEKVGEQLETFEQSADGMLPQRFVGKNAAIHFDAKRRMWVGIEITSGDDL